MRRLEKGFVHVGVNNLAAEYILKDALFDVGLAMTERIGECS